MSPDAVTLHQASPTPDMSPRPQCHLHTQRSTLGAQQQWTPGMCELADDGGGFPTELLPSPCQTLQPAMLE
jgi:hypothetical protein